MALSGCLFSTGNDEWETPQDLYNALNDEFHFTLDACATPQNAKCQRFYTRNDDGLSQSWKGEVVFCNPPYSRKAGQNLWIKKAYEEAKEGNAIVVMLLPSRTDTKAFHEFIYNKAAEIRFIRGRLKFGGMKQGAPFPSMIVIYDFRKKATP
jgi:phage N-6-adenine-methyltransferase